MKIEVTSDAAGHRLDQFLSSRKPEISRSRWAKLIDGGAVLVNEVPAKGASQKLKAGQVVTLAPLAERELSGEKDEVDASLPIVFRGQEPRVLFEDAFLAVIDKPCGLTVHPGNGVQIEDTVAGWLLATGRVKATASGDQDEESVEEWEEELSGGHRLGIVHRLDRGTTGVMVVAKTPGAHTRLAEQFATREAGRMYWAVSHGLFDRVYDARPPLLERLLRRVPSPVGLRLQRLGEERVLSLATRLERDPRERQRFRVSQEETGRRAVTHVAGVSMSAPLSLVECKLDTGRTHQIRVHLSFLGLPIVGDALYGGREHARLMLHAHTLRLIHPETDEKLEFHAPWPAKDAEWIRSQGLEISSKGELWHALKSDSAKAGPED